MPRSQGWGPVTETPDPLGYWRNLYSSLPHMRLRKVSQLLLRMNCSLPELDLPASRIVKDVFADSATLPVVFVLQQLRLRVSYNHRSQPNPAQVHGAPTPRCHSVPESLGCFMYVYMVCVCTCVWKCLWRPEADVFLCHCPLYMLRQSLSLDPSSLFPPLQPDF